MTDALTTYMAEQKAAQVIYDEAIAEHAEAYDAACAPAMAEWQETARATLAVHAAAAAAAEATLVAAQAEAWQAHEDVISPNREWYQAVQEEVRLAAGLDTTAERAQRLLALIDEAAQAV